MSEERLGVHVVWLKRDLRWEDHRPIFEASTAGLTVVLYVFEPKLWAAPEMDRSHFDFIVQSLEDLSSKLVAAGGRLAIRVGELPDVFSDLSSSHRLVCLYSHEETGNRFTYDRDRRVGRWAKEAGVVWREYPQNGVVRRLKSRDGWSGLWQARMKEPAAPSPSRMHVPSDFDWGSFPSAEELGLEKSNKNKLPVGGSVRAETVLQSFLSERGKNYAKGMSSPVTSWDDCSRLSPYLAWGCISIKSVHQQLAQRQRELAATDTGNRDRGWNSALRAFSSRLSWHCHFMQKLEDEPQLEFENLCRAYDGMRENDFNQERFEAWKEGKTGYPMVDACMRALLAHSWINFRMRAMLVSFASNHLWLHWRPTALHLAKHFIDFEPGIHFSQCQMQSGTTGINTVRIYSPAKQVVDQDPKGIFIRQFVPELSNVPNEFLSEPHRMPLDVQMRIGCRIGTDYPAPIVDHRTAYHAAQQKIFAIRKTEGAIAEAQKVLTKHGSRKRRDPMPRRTEKPPSALRQLTLFEDETE